MIDPFLLLAPFLVLLIVGLLGFVGCDVILGVSGADEAPTLVATPGDQKAFLSWNTDGFGEFTLQRNAAPDNSVTNLPPQPAGTASFIDTGLINGTTYTYSITSSKNGESAGTSQASVTPEPITFRQFVENVETVGNATVATLPFPSLGQGSLVIVWIWYHSGTESVSTVTDNANNMYKRAVGPTPGANQLAGQQQEIWYLENVNAGNNVIVTAQFSAGFNNEKSITAHEYTGAAPTDALEATAMDTQATATPSSGNATVAQSSLIFGAAIFSGSGTADTAAGFNARSTIKANASEDRRITAPGSVAATFIAPSVEDWIAQMATFR